MSQERIVTPKDARDTGKTEAEKTYDVGYKGGVNAAIDSLESTGYRDVFGRSAADHLRHHLLGVEFSQAWHEGEETS